VGSNFYGYVGGNAPNLRDSTGLFPTWDHRNITIQAALNSGYSEVDAKQLAELVVNVDFLPGSQETDANDTNLHAMAGTKADGTYQTCQEAYAATQAELAKYITNGNPAAIAAALHIIQDSYSPAHAGYQEWHGGYTKYHIPGLAHMYGDAVKDYSAARSHATVASQTFLRDLLGKDSALSNPANYLAACGCKK
jgi:hypothetical protein